jgi:DNA-binding LacI/PurR family transcriptional regulator
VSSPPPTGPPAPAVPAAPAARVPPAAPVPPAALARTAGIRDVARVAGVSPTTVSHALNGLGRLSDQTRRHVLAVADQLGYRANPSARNMRASSTGLIAVINQLSEGTSWGATDLEYVMRLNQAVCAGAWDRGSYPTLLPPRVSAATLRRMPLDGAILVDPVPGDASLHALDTLAIPAITVGRDDTGAPGRGWWADNDIRACAAMALDHLAAGGAGRIMMISADTGQSYLTDAAAGYQEWCAGRREPSRLAELAAPYRGEECFALVSRACAGRWPVDGLYLAVEALVQPALDALAAAGRGVPGDVQVVVASDSQAARSARPALTALDLNPEAIGAAAVGLLEDRLSSPGAATPTAVIPAAVIPRGSTRVRPAPAAPAGTPGSR